jgi:hypothetical protein
MLLPNSSPASLSSKLSSKHSNQPIKRLKSNYNLKQPWLNSKMRVCCL